MQLSHDTNPLYEGREPDAREIECKKRLATEEIKHAWITTVHPSRKYSIPMIHQSESMTTARKETNQSEEAKDTHHATEDDKGFPHSIHHTPPKPQVVRADDASVGEIDISPQAYKRKHP